MNKAVERVRQVLAAGAIGLVVTLASLSVARATAPLGACCLTNGACVDLVSFQCDGQGGEFIGGGTSCATVRCDAPVAAPLLSILGMVAAVGALAGLGVYRLLIGRRRT
jgi:hypothetical protein